MVVLLSLLSVGVAVTTATVTHDRSLAQVSDTLQKLLTSINDSDQANDALSNDRQSLCDGLLKRFQAGGERLRESLVDAQAKITEAEAEAEDWYGTVGQIKVDIEMVQHTIGQTEKMLKEHTAQEGLGNDDTKRITSLIENKQLSLSSLQSELNMAVPALAQLQENIAEMKERASRRTESEAAGQDFMAELREQCAAASARADTRASTHKSEYSSIDAALQSLVVRSAASSPQGSSAYPFSFVQVDDERIEEVSSDDLTDIFAEMPKPTVQPVTHTSPMRVRANGSSEVELELKSVGVHVRALLLEVKSWRSDSVMSQEEWCSKQRLSGELGLKFAKDSMARITSESDAHAEAEAEISEELTMIQAATATATESTMILSKYVGKEQSLIRKARKDQQLAMKILEQASTILKDLGVTNVTQVLGALESAEKMLATEISASADFEKDVSSKAKAVLQKARDFNTAQESEQHNLDFVKEDHTMQRLEGAKNLRLYDSDVQEATAFMQHLQDSCKANVISQTKEQYSAQVHALEDSEKALQGKLIAPKAGGLRGRQQIPTQKDLKGLSPMQQAAMEMGISVD